MKKLLGGAGLALMLAACATSNSVTPAEIASVESNKGAVTIVGLPASQVLGAIDTTKLVGSAPDKVVANQPKQAGEAPVITHDGNVLRVEGVPPAAVLAAIDPTKLISNPKQAEGNRGLPPEVAEVVKNNKRYTTQQLAQAQLEAVRNGGPG